MLSNSYIMDCPLVRGLSYIHVGNCGITISYHLQYISVDVAHHEIFRAKCSSKGGINTLL